MRLVRRVFRPRKQMIHSPFWQNQNALVNIGLTRDREGLENNFGEYVKELFKTVGPVYGTIAVRMLVFSEARMMWQKLEKGRPGDLHYSPELDVLNNSDQLLTDMEVDLSLAGNAYHTKVDEAGNLGKSATVGDVRLVRMRPDWTDILVHSPSGNPWSLDAVIAGYLYRPQGGPDGDRVILLRDEVAHYTDMPDPVARFRGMSWLQAVVRDAMSDRKATEHKEAFFDNGATLAQAVKFPEGISKDDFDTYVEKFKAQHEGHKNAYKTLFVGGGADVSTVGVDFAQLSFSQTQGAGETRIALAGGVPPVIVGMSEGLQAATYSNYGQARRRFADGTMRPLWRKAAASLRTLVDVPDGSRLWYDDRDIAFLREDRRDVAEIQVSQSSYIRALTESGYDPRTITAALVADDPTLLKHTGRASVQLHPVDEDPNAENDNNGGEQLEPNEDNEPNSEEDNEDA